MPYPCTVQGLAKFLLDHRETGFTWGDLQARGFPSDWVDDNMIAVRALVRDEGLFVPWPTAYNDYKYMATTSDEARRKGDEVRWKHISTHLREAALDLEVAKIIEAGKNPVNTMLVLLLNLAYDRMADAHRDLTRVADAMVEVTPAGTPVRKIAPHYTRAVRLIP